MTDQDVMFEAPYVDYGKIFSVNGASDFETLNYSHDWLLNNVDFFRKHILSFPKKTSFKKRLGAVSVALLPADTRGNYIFVQIQRRREDEFSNNPRAGSVRPFNQIRFTYLTENDIEQQNRDKNALLTGLLFDATKYGENKKDDTKPFSLKDYFHPGAKIPWVIQLKSLDLIRRSVNDHYIRGIVNMLVHESKRTPLPKNTVTILDDSLNLYEKLSIIQHVQYWLLPYLGIITFTLDYISERNVMVRFFDSRQERSLPSSNKTYSLNQLVETTFTDDYYTTTSDLDSDELYHGDLKRFLGEARNTTDAVIAFRLVENNARPPDFCQWLGENFRLIQHELGKIVDDMTVEERLELIYHREIPDELIILLLEHECRQRGDISNYYRYHLAATSAERDNNQTLLLLKESIQQSRVEGLNVIPVEMRLAICQELLPIRSDTCFASPVEDQERVSILAGLMRYWSEQVLMVVEEPIKVNNVSQELLMDEVLNELEQQNVVWQPKQYLPLLEMKIFAEPSRFNSLLNVLVRRQAHLVEEPEVFKSFLLKGEEIYKSSSDDIDGQNAALLLQLENEPQLREALREVSLQLSREDIQFAEWWVYNEISYLEKSQIIKDFGAMFTSIRRLRSLDPDSVSEKFACLIEPDLFENKLSLKKACEYRSIIAHKDKFDDFNENLFWAVLSVWNLHDVTPSNLAEDDLFLILDGLPSVVEAQRYLALLLQSNLSLRNLCQLVSGVQSEKRTKKDPILDVLRFCVDYEVPLSLSDVSYLITEQLPRQPQINSYLAEMLANENQAIEWTKISPEVALVWLRITRGNNRDSYIKNGTDVLYETLKRLETPNEDFLWEMFQTETGSWKAYLTNCNYWEDRLRDLGISEESAVSEYLLLSSKLVLNSPNEPTVVQVNTNLLRTMVDYEFSNDTTQSSILDSLGDSDLRGLLVWLSVEEQDLAVKEIAEGILHRYLESTTLVVGLGNLTEKTIQQLWRFGRGKNIIIDYKVEVNEVNKKPIMESMGAASDSGPFLLPPQSDNNYEFDMIGESLQKQSQEGSDDSPSTSVLANALKNNWKVILLVTISIATFLSIGYVIGLCLDSIIDLFVN